jgi:hypothetical protein
MNSSYRILKLQSGEEIIAKIKGKERGRIVLDNPMIFKTATKNDMFGQTTEVTFLKDWLSNTTSDIIDIPENFIVSWLKPSNNVTRLYDIERNIKREEKHRGPIPKPLQNPLKEDRPSNSDFQKLLNEMFSDNNTKNPEDMLDQPFFMHMMIPPDLVKDLFDQGLLDDVLDAEFDDDIDDDFHEEVNEQEFTGDEKDHPHYGNRWTDWNPDPHDDEYL